MMMILMCGGQQAGQYCCKPHLNAGHRIRTLLSRPAQNETAAKQGTCVFRRRERYANLILGIVKAYAASTVGNTGMRGDFGSWEVEG